MENTPAKISFFQKGYLYSSLIYIVTSLCSYFFTYTLKWVFHLIKVSYAGVCEHLLERKLLEGRVHIMFIFVVLYCIFAL